MSLEDGARGRRTRACREELDRRCRRRSGCPLFDCGFNAVAAHVYFEKLQVNISREACLGMYYLEHDELIQPLSGSNEPSVFNINVASLSWSHRKFG